MPPFALSIFLGAFLLFAVQPLVGKFVLPWFGGGPGVWTTCLLFFQTVLLGGYLYAHFSARYLTPRRQAMLHLSLLAIALLLLPITPAVSWKPPDGEDPIWRILLLLTASVGLPYFVLSATGPLMQQWFSQTQPDRSPYRLYALSNAGSLLALLSYPFYFERAFSRHTQATLWSVGIALFAAAASWCAWRVWRAPRMASNAPRSEPSAAPPPSPLDRLLWFSLAAIASILLLATTNKLCQDLAVVPFLWVLPLSLYLLSFILCFDHPRWYSRGAFSALFALGALTDAYLLFAGHGARLSQQIIGYSATLFAACMICHGELFRLRPAPSRLTSFYLHIATGGAAGSFLVAIVAPLVFDRYLELQIGLWLLTYFIGVAAFRHRSRAFAVGTAAGAFAASLLIPALKATAKRDSGSWTAFGEQLKTFYQEHWTFVAFLAAAFLLGFVGRRGWVREWELRVGNFLMLFSIGIGAIMIVQIHRDTESAVSTSRDFYGVLKVFEHNRDDANTHYYALINGVTSHGLQFTLPEKSIWPTTYYGETSGVGLVLRELSRDPRSPPLKIGLVGLGTGTVAIYGQPGGTVRIYEIDPRVEKLARTQFSYLEKSAATVDVVIGVRGPVAPPEMCNGLMLPIVAFDQIYSFDRDSLIKDIPRPEKATEKEFTATAHELFERIMLLADNAGATDENRALNYLAVRYPAVYAMVAAAHGRSASLSAVEVRPSALSAARNVMDVIFSVTNRNTDVTEKFAARVDVTEEFPFLVSKLSPYFDR